MDGPLAYFITIRGYGTWLPGDKRGSMDYRHNAYDSPSIEPNMALEQWARTRLKTPPVTFDAARRAVITHTIESVCQHKGWSLLAINTRTNHVHVVIVSQQPPERIMTTLKSWATRRMVGANVLASGVKAWSRHGSTRYLWTEQQVEEACTYVVDGQGEPLD